MSAKPAKPLNPSPHSYLFAARIAVGCVFIVSGFQKLTQPYQNFLYVVQNFEVLPEWAEAAVAHAFPWIELFGGVFLVFGLWTGLMLRLLWLANSAFVVILAQAIVRKLPIRDCGCFGEMIRLPLPVMLGFDLGMWLVFGLLVVFERSARRFGLDNRFDGSS